MSLLDPSTSSELESHKRNIQEARDAAVAGKEAVAQTHVQLQDMVAAGSILELNLAGGLLISHFTGGLKPLTIDFHAAIEELRGLAKALQSETCRVTELECAVNSAWQRIIAKIALTALAVSN